MNQTRIKKQAINILAVTVLATSSLGGLALTQPVDVEAATTSQIKLTEKQAIKKFNKQFKNINVDEITLEKEHGKYRYEVSGADNQKEYTADIDAKSGKVLRTDTEKLDNGEQKTNLELSNLISRKQANKIAEQQVKNSKGQSWTLENENGTPVWDVEVASGKTTTEVKINAQTKQVISTNQDD